MDEIKVYPMLWDIIKAIKYRIRCGYIYLLLWKNRRRFRAKMLDDPYPGREELANLNEMRKTHPQMFFEEE